MVGELGGLLFMAGRDGHLYNPRSMLELPAGDSAPPHAPRARRRRRPQDGRLGWSASRIRPAICSGWVHDAGGGPRHLAVLVFQRGLLGGWDRHSAPHCQRAHCRVCWSHRPCLHAVDCPSRGARGDEPPERPPCDKCTVAQLPTGQPAPHGPSSSTHR